MIIIEVDNTKDGIEKALKKYKRKFDKVKTVKKLRERQSFKKKSVKRREEIKKAARIKNEIFIMIIFCLDEGSNSAKPVCPTN